MAPPSPPPSDAPAPADVVAAVAAHPPGPDGAWELIGMVAAEPVVGRVYVALWAEQTDPDTVEVRHELRDARGEPIADTNTLQETLTLVAMAETLEELAAPDLAEEAGTALDALLEHMTEPPPELTAAADALARVREHFAATAPPADAPRVVTPTQLDGHSAVLRDLEMAWQAAEHVAGHLLRGEHDIGIEPRELFQVLAIVRERMLAVTPAVAVEQGRAAGEMLAKEAAATMIVRGQ